MVLLSKLFFFVWIPYYALGMIWPTSPPKTGFREVSESIEQKLKWCSNDKQRADALRGHLIDARLSKPVESAVKSVVEIAIDKAMEYGANLGNLKNVNKVMDILFRAGLTRQALSNLEMNALPRVLYVDKNLNRYDKWMLALTMYRNPILDAIRAALDKEGLKIRQFALAACSLHSLISPQLAHPDLKLYRLPEATKSIKEFCSFVDELNFDTFVTEEEMFDEQRDFMLKSYKGAAHLVCESALLYPEELFDPKQEEEVFKRSNDEFSAIIVIWNANDLDLKIANNFLNVLLEKDEFKGNVEIKRVEKLPVKKLCINDPITEKKFHKYNLAFYFLCKYIPSESTKVYDSDLQDNYGLRIKDQLSAHFDEPKKTMSLYLSHKAYTRIHYS